MEVVYDRAIAGDTGAQCVILLAVGGNLVEITPHIS